jgi:GPH family glycoside/pentoside/hexuronide:cation symporter
MQLPRSQRIAYGVSDLGASLTFVAINTWLLYALINVAGVPAVWAGAIFVSGRLVDALTDPLMGVLGDRWRDRIGRLPFLRWGAVPLGVTFAAVWWAPDLSAGAAIGYALVTFILFGIAYTVVQVPTMALTPALAPGYDERTALTGWRIGFGVVASMLAVATPPLIVLSVTGGGELAAAGVLGWRVFAVIFATIAILAYLTTATFVREPTHPPSPPATATRAPWWSAFQATGYTSVWVLFLLVTMGIMTLNSMLPFFLESALALPGDAQTLVLGTLFGVAILSFPLWGMVSARLGKRGALTTGLLLLAAATLTLVYTAPSGAVSPLLLLLSAIAGVGLAAVMMLPWAMLPDVVEFDAWRSGERREGLLYALFTFGQKVAGSLGVFANAIAATLFGYVQGQALQAPETVFGIQLMTGPVSAGIFLLAAAWVWTFPITRERHREMQTALASREHARGASAR